MCEGAYIGVCVCVCVCVNHLPHLVHETWSENTIGTIAYFVNAMSIK